jgi:mono/diheme cytochrome c family protein
VDITRLAENEGRKMHFLRDALITIVLLAVAAAITAFIVVRRGGLAANAEPGPLERSIATRLVRLSIPADADRHQSPLSGQPDAWRQARDHFQDHCAICHGDDAKGHTEIGANMYPKVPDLTSAPVQARSDGALFHIIQNGIRWTGMPAWKAEHTPEQTWQLVAFIRKAPTLTASDLKIDKPAATTEEKKDHDKAPHHHRH